MDYENNIVGLLFFGFVAFISTLSIVLVVYGINRYRLNWFEQNLLETQYLEISPDDANKECSSISNFWVQSKSKLKKSSTGSSVDHSIQDVDSTTKDNALPLIGNNNVIITTNNSLTNDGVLLAQPILEQTDDQQEIIINDKIEGDSRGKVHISVFYDKIAEILTVRLIEAQDLMARDYNGTADPYAKIRLLPDEINVWQTKIHKKTTNPVFDEDFVFEVPETTLEKHTLEIIFYDFEAYSRHNIIGGLRLPLLALKKEEKLDVWEKLFVVYEPVPSKNMGELMVSLSYLPVKECLTVNVIKARNLQAVDNTRAASDPYVKLTFSCNGRRLKRCKTKIRRNTIYPTFNESFIFNINKQTLKNGTILFEVFHDNLLGVDQLLGKCCIGKEKMENDAANYKLLDIIQNRDVAGKWLQLKE